MIRWTGVALLTLICPSMILGQAVPLIHHYSTEVTEAHPQNWAVTQDNSGYLYFGSQAEVVLKFDSVNWNGKYEPGTGAIRSLVPYKSRVHWGGVGDFGYLESDSLHDFTLISLKDQITSSHQSFKDVWQLLEFDGRLYHRTSNAIYILSEDTIRVVGSEDTIRGLFKVDRELWASRDESGLTRLENNRWSHIPDADLFAGDRLIAVLPYPSYNLLIFRNQGFVRYDGQNFSSFSTEADNYLQDHTLYKAIAVNETDIALAFLNGGIVLMKKDGTVDNILNESSGLPTNVIYELFTDREGTLWATSADGVIKILTNNPLTTMQEQTGFNGVASFITSVGDTMYFGSTNGLFVLEKGKKIRKHHEFNGYAYTGTNLEGDFYLSTISGFFRISGDQIDKIDDRIYHKLESSMQSHDVFYGARLNRIDQIKVNGKSIEYSEVLRSESSEIRDFYAGVDGLWAVTYQNEVLFVSLDNRRKKKYRPKFKNQELPIRHISLIDNKMRLATDSGLYMYDRSSDSFLPDSSFNLYSPISNDSDIVTTQVFQFEQCSDDQIWFRSGQQTKRAIRNNDSWEIIEKPYRLIGDDSSIQEIHCNPDGSVWFGGSEGLYHLSDPDWTYDHDFNTNITGVLMRNDSLIYGGHGDLPEFPEFKYADNELRFTYAAASYIKPEANTYQVRLRGYDDDWSNWSEETQKDYTFIPEGTYTFEVQGRNVYEKEGSIDSFTFIILPPWYRTIWAYFGYLLIAGGMIYGGYRVRLNTILREQRIRDGIARDLHDELSSTLSSINFFADAINSRKLGETENNRFLSLITKSSKEAKEKVSDIVWVIHSENDDWENLLLRCKRFAADMLDSRGVKHHFIAEGNFSGKPSITERKNVWLIFREILTNIARHADAGQVDIRFSLKSGKLQLRIEDDGKGFDPENIQSNGYGVQNIKERAEQLKGECTLKSIPGEGTRWVIEVSLR